MKFTSMTGRLGISGFGRTAILALCLAVPQVHGQADPKSTVTEELVVDSDSPIDSSDEAPSDSFDLAIHLESFDQVWETVQKSHWDETMLAEKWSTFREKYRPQVESASSIEEVRGVIRAMIDELDLSHFGIIESSAVELVHSDDESGEGISGIEFRLVKDGVLVFRVAEGSDAEELGVEPGWLVEKIGKLDVAELVEKIRSAAHGPIRAETIVAMALPRLASGPEGETKLFRFVDRHGDVQELEIELQPEEGEYVAFGHLPPICMQTRVETLPNGIGYLWFNAFFNPIKFMPLFRDVIRGEDHRSGIIVDLRGNMGGMAGMTMGIASEFSDQKATLGVMTMKGTELKFFVNENAEPVTCPVAILVDENSVSSAEILAGGLQDLKLARIFGSRTAGLALPSMVIRLANGDGFQYAIADYHSASGKSLEKDGVVPDESVELTRELLLAETDPALNRAIAWIASENQQRTGEK